MGKKVTELGDHFEIVSLKDKTASGLHHFQATVKRTDAVGTGTDENELVALQKAVHEAAERHVFKESHRKLRIGSSSGFACHFGPNEARLNAFSEVLERDAFLLSWLLKRPPVWVQEDQYTLLRAANKQLAPFGMKIVSGLVAKTGEFSTIVSILLPISSDEFGGVFSCACSTSIEKAMLSTHHELSRAATVVQNRRGKSGFEFKRSMGSVAATSDHFDYYLDPANREKFQWMFDNDEAPLHELPFLDATYYYFNVNFLPWNPVVAFCDHKKYQSFFVGKTTVENINFGRLLQVAASCRFTDLNRDLHPLP